jgi:hypothetical protein
MMCRVSHAVIPFPLLALLVVSGCASGIPKEALLINEQSMAERQMQTRRFETSDEKKVLVATAGLLQDLGFNLDESETDLGVVVGSKDRDAVEAGQVFGAFLLTAFFGAPMIFDERQRMRASVITRPVGEENSSIAVRVTFQRIVWDTENRVSKAEALKDPEQYQEFFSKLSKALFLEAHEI